MMAQGLAYDIEAARERGIAEGPFAPTARPLRMTDAKIGGEAVTGGLARRFHCAAPAWKSTVWYGGLAFRGRYRRAGILSPP